MIGQNIYQYVIFTEASLVVCFEHIDITAYNSIYSNTAELALHSKFSFYHQ